MYYTYVLKSEKDNKLYIGYTSNIENRILLHQGGQVDSTKNRLPVKLIYYEAFLSKKDAQNEEKYLKSGGNAHNGLILRLSESLKL